MSLANRQHVQEEVLGTGYGQGDKAVGGSQGVWAPSLGMMASGLALELDW